MDEEERRNKLYWIACRMYEADLPLRRRADNQGYNWSDTNSGDQDQWLEAAAIAIEYLEAEGLIVS